MKTLFLIVFALLAMSLPNTQVHAQPNATYALAKSSIGPGASGSTSIYELSSSIGQSDAGEVSAGIYTLGGGFWGGGIIVPASSIYNIYLPLVLR